MKESESCFPFDEERGPVPDIQSLGIIFDARNQFMGRRRPAFHHFLPVPGKSGVYYPKAYGHEEEEQAKEALAVLKQQGEYSLQPTVTPVFIEEEQTYQRKNAKGGIVEFHHGVANGCVIKGENWDRLKHDRTTRVDSRWNTVKYRK